MKLIRDWSIVESEVGLELVHQPHGGWRSIQIQLHLDDDDFMMTKTIQLSDDATQESSPS